ncbi:MAG: phosphatidylserine decarboxylase [Proteobacteria bacterium]|nr:phosphatidylserine decarboxylase [Pseudomonadota bacterium]
MPGLFCRNERLVFDLRPKEGGRLWVVMVGALNVGRIVTPLKPDFASNSSFRLLDPSNVKEHTINAVLDAGDEIGTFMLGSTVVLVLDREAAKSLTPKALSGQRNVRMGESLSFMG